MLVMIVSVQAKTSNSGKLVHWNICHLEIGGTTSNRVQTKLMSNEFLMKKKNYQDSMLKTLPHNQSTNQIIQINQINKTSEMRLSVLYSLAQSR